MPNCPICGSEVTGYHCQSCGAVLGPPPGPYPPPRYWPVPYSPPYRLGTTQILILTGLIVGIALFIVFSIVGTYEMGDMHVEDTPHASMTLQDTDTPGMYIILWQGSVESDRIDIGLYDDSIVSTTVEEQPSGSPDGLLIQVLDGCNLTWYDNNDNDELDGADTLILRGGGSGDRVTVVYRPTGEIIAACTIA